MTSYKECVQKNKSSCTGLSKGRSGYRDCLKQLGCAAKPRASRATGSATVWQAHLRKVKENNAGMPYKQVLKLASSTYKPPSKVPKRPPRPNPISLAMLTDVMRSPPPIPPKPKKKRGRPRVNKPKP